MYSQNCYSTFIPTHLETIPGFFNVFYYFISLNKTKTLTIVCIYIQGVRTDLFCKLCRSSPYSYNKSTQETKI